MENRENRTPTGQETDISKAQSQQQPQGQAGQQPEKGEKQGQQFGQGEQFETRQQGQQPEFGEDKAAGSPDLGQQGDTLAQQRTDIEGASLQSEEEDEAGTGFVGSKSERDTSGELIKDEDEDFTPEGK